MNIGTVTVEDLYRETEKAIIGKVQGIKKIWLPKTLMVSWNRETNVIELPFWVIRDRGLVDEKSKKWKRCHAK